MRHVDAQTACYVKYTRDLPKLNRIQSHVHTFDYFLKAINSKHVFDVCVPDISTQPQMLSPEVDAAFTEYKNLPEGGGYVFLTRASAYDTYVTLATNCINRF